MPAEHPDPELAGYRPVNAWSVAALLLGLAAPLAFVHPMLWCVPATGVAVAIVAMLRIRNSEVPTIGRKGAMVGLVLSLVICTAAPTRYLTRTYWLKSRAEELAQKWFEFLRTGQMENAFNLTFHTAPRRIPEPHGGAAAPPKAPEKTALQAFAERPPVAKLLALGEHAHPVVIGADIKPEEMGRQNIDLLYQIESPSEHGLRPFILLLETQRRLEPGGRERWLVEGTWAQP